MRAIKQDPGSAAVDAPTRALLEFAAKLARTPPRVERSDVEVLRAHGFDDRDITDLVHNVGFFSYINRVGEGLGVELEPFMLAGGENVDPGAALDPD